MAPGVVCVWSRTDPDAGAQNSDNEDEWTFTDPIASLQGVSRGVRLEAAEQQSVEPPYTHDIPFLTMYELPDVTYHQEKEFKESEAQCVFEEKDGLKPRVYVEVECMEAEGFKGDPVIGELFIVVTGEGFPEGFAEEFWTFHREDFVGSFMQSPEFIRSQVFKMAGDVGSEVENEIPSGPYLFVYQWDSPEVPWSEFIAAAQTEGYKKHIENGIKWQAMNYHPIRFTKKQAREGNENAELDNSGESKEEDADGMVKGEKSEAEEVSVDEKSKNEDVTEQKNAESKELGIHEATGPAYHGGQETVKAREDGEHAQKLSKE